MVLGNSVDAQVTGFQSLNAATGVWNGRTLVAGSGISITNPTGTAGDPTIASTGVSTLTVTGQAFTAPGAFTYTPTANMKFVIVELQGGGGGSGGAAAVTALGSISGGGGAGAYARFILTAAQVGASLSGSVGAAGTAGAAGANTGGTGGSTTLATAAAWTCAGGIGGPASAAAAVNAVEASFGGVVTTGTGTILVTMSGGQGSNGIQPAGCVIGSTGGGSPLGNGGGGRAATSTPVSSSGYAATGYGSGGGGAVNFGTFAAIAGQVGQSGIAIFTEFVTT